MLPHDITPTRMELPPGPRDSAVMFSGSRPRHLRLGYLLQRRFPGLLKAWYVADPPRQARVAAKLDKLRGMWRNSASVAAARERLSIGELDDLWELATLARKALGKVDVRRAARAVLSYALPNDYDAIETQMFGRELEGLKADAELHPAIVPTPNDETIIAAIGRMQPYFIVTFGGPLLRGRLLRSARGIALNQHAGWSPHLRGASTVETALYHRQLGWVGNTVHLMDTFADSGPILRRSTAAIHPDDRVGHCFMASTALGTKMMLECLERAIRQGELTVFPQPQSGQTVNIIDYVPAKRAAVARDVSSRWMSDALSIVREY